MSEPEHDLAALVHARGQALVRFAHALSGNRVLAEDLVQEALAKVFRRFGDQLPVERPEAYVRQVIVREFLQWRRRRGPIEVHADVPDAPAWPDGDGDRREMMWRALAELPRRQRAVLVLGFYEDLADREIAAAIGCSEVTVRTQRLRALAKLRGVVELTDPRLAPSTLAIAPPRKA